MKDNNILVGKQLLASNAVNTLATKAARRNQRRLWWTVGSMVIGCSIVLLWNTII